MAWTLEKVPCAIQGIALGNSGLASLFVLLGKVYHRSDEVLIAVYILAPVSLFFTVLYFGKVMFHPAAFKADAAAPATAFTFGAMAINLSILSSLLIQLGFSYEYGLVGVSCAALFQLVQEIWFLHLCFETRTHPQPFWNAATVSVTITSITGAVVHMPVSIRRTSWFLGFTTMVLTIPPQLWSVFKHHRFLGGNGDPSDIPPLNNNPSVAVLQATASILCSGWHAAPIVVMNSTDAEEEDVIGGILFVTSMALFTLTVVALVARWKSIHRAFSTEHPSVSAMTFPFVITATAAAFCFQRNGGKGLEMVVWALFGLCSSLVGCITLIYFKLIVFGDMLWALPCVPASRDKGAVHPNLKLKSGKASGGLSMELT